MVEQVFLIEPETKSPRFDDNTDRTFVFLRGQSRRYANSVTDKESSELRNVMQFREYKSQGLSDDETRQRIRSKQYKY